MDSRYYQQFTKLYESAFPIEERRPTALELRLQNDSYHCDIITHQDNFAGFITWWDFEPCCYVEYFAIVPELRCQGLGAKALKQLVTKTTKPIVLEVELPNTEQARKRLDFYERCGFRPFPQAYIQPPYSDDPIALPLVLMTNGTDVSDSCFEQMRHTLYKYVYKAE